MEALARLFGGAEKVKLMRLFLLNPNFSFTVAEATGRCRISSRAAAVRELANLAALGLIQKKRLRRQIVWRLDRTFPIIAPLTGILKDDLISRQRELVRHFGRCGKLSLLVVSGVFIDQNDSRADLLLVGNLNRSGVERAIKRLEAEIGRELSYAVLTADDFNYRLTACDKFIRDIFDYPHVVVFDKFGLISGRS